MLQRIHASVDSARAALHNGQTRRKAPVGLALLRTGVAKAAARMLPGGAAVVGAVTGARSTERLAIRAIRYYRSI
jgi:hypothetical protein